MRWLDGIIDSMDVSLSELRAKLTILQLLSIRPSSAFGSNKREATPSCPLQLRGHHRQIPEPEGTLGIHASVPALCYVGLRSLHL